MMRYTAPRSYDFSIQFLLKLIFLILAHPVAFAANDVIKKSEADNAHAGSVCADLLELPDLALPQDLAADESAASGTTAGANTNANANDQISSAIQFLRERVQAGELALTDLQALHEGKNPLAARPDFASQQYAKVLDVMLSQFAQNSAQAEAWGRQINQLRASLNQTHDVRAEKKQETSIPFYKVGFVRVAAYGLLPVEQQRALINEGWDLTVKIDQDFEFMNAPLTQMQYAQMFSLLQRFVPTVDGDPAPSEYRDTHTALSLTLGANTIRISPDQPVESVSYKKILEVLLPALNRLSAEGGADVQSALAAIFPGHAPGDRYDLPTREQYLFVAYNAKTAQGKTLDHIINEKGAKAAPEIKKYVALTSDLGGTIDVRTGPPAIGATQPLLYNQAREVYLRQGVSEWVKYEFKKAQRGDFTRVKPAIGANMDSKELFKFKANMESWWLPGHTLPFVGFRLVRTRSAS